MDQAVVLSVLSALDSLTRRNKNQHGSSLWWRHFALLRRCLRKIAVEQELGRIEAARRRVRFLAQNLTPRCYEAFGHVVADGQYAPLGAVLMALLARVHRAVAVTEAKWRESEAKAGNDKTVPKIDAREANIGHGEQSRRQRERRSAEVKSRSKPKDSIDALFAGLV